MDVFDLKRPIFKEKRLPAFSVPFFFFSKSVTNGPHYRPLCNRKPKRKNGKMKPVSAESRKYSLSFSILPHISIYVKCLRALKSKNSESFPKKTIFLPLIPLTEWRFSFILNENVGKIVRFCCFPIAHLNFPSF